jgi:hypothetical protein
MHACSLFHCNHQQRRFYLHNTEKRKCHRCQPSSAVWACTIRYHKLGCSKQCTTISSAGYSENVKPTLFVALTFKQRTRRSSAIPVSLTQSRSTVFTNSAMAIMSVVFPSWGNHWQHRCGVCVTHTVGQQLSVVHLKTRHANKCKHLNLIAFPEGDDIILFLAAFVPGKRKTGWEIKRKLLFKCHTRLLLCIPHFSHLCRHSSVDKTLSDYIWQPRAHTSPVAHQNKVTTQRLLPA